MGLSSDLISQFVKITNDTKKTKKETTTYGTIVTYNGGMYVRLDGSDLLTPMTKTVGVKDGDRVMISIKDHAATVTGNISSPSASSSEVKDVDDKVGNFMTLTAKEFEAQSAKISDLKADNITIKDKLTANEGYISDLKADNLTIKDKLATNEAEVKKLTTDYATISSLVATKASIDDLEATNANVRNLVSDYGDFKVLATDKLTANEAAIKKLDVDKADIDLANVNNAWIQNGIIKNGAITEATIHDGAITNVKIADATIEAAKIKSINADTITAGTLKTNRLIITGEDGTDSIVKAINTANGVVEANSTKIQAASIDVVDLSAFNAKIAQFILKDNAIYSGKTSIVDPTSGIYISTTGIGIGNGTLTDANESPIQMYADGGIKLKGKNGYIDFDSVTGELDIDATTLKISSKTVASNDDVTNAIDGIEVGGRNYILDSAFKNYTPDSSNIHKIDDYIRFNGGQPGIAVPLQVSDNFATVARGKKIALSIDIQVLTNSIVFGENPWIGLEIAVIYADNTSDEIVILGGSKIPPTRTLNWINYKQLVTLQDKVIRSTRLSIRCEDFRGVIRFRHPQIEISTKVSDWTPAPEDIETRVTSAETSIEQNSTEISLRATKEEVSTAKSEAIDTAASDATAKADTALATAKSYADSQIKISADNITSSVNTLAENVNGYIENSTKMIQDINGWQFNWNKILRTDEANTAEHQDYITFQNGDIILGESGSDSKVKIGNDAIQFKGKSQNETAVTPDSDTTAWITGQLFNINAGEIHTSLKIGNLRLSPRSNGNFIITIA